MSGGLLLQRNTETCANSSNLSLCTLPSIEIFKQVFACSWEEEEDRRLVVFRTQPVQFEISLEYFKHNQLWSESSTSTI